MKPTGQGGRLATAVALALLVAVPASAGPGKDKGKPAQHPGQDKGLRKPEKPGGESAPGQARKESKKLRNRDKGSLAEPIAGSLWKALGLKFKKGSAFRVAWSSRKRWSVMKRDVREIRQKRGDVYSTPYYVDYQVVQVKRHRLAGKERSLAKIRISWVKAPRFARVKYAELWVDQYFNPVSWRYVAKHLPYGRRRDLDTRSAIRRVGPFPLVVPDLENIQAQPGAVPRLAASLAKLKMVKGRRVLKGTLKAGRASYDVYWSPGLPYASAVVGPNVQGVLVAAK